MPTYSYEGVNSAGKKQKGEREAVSRQALMAELVAEGVFASKVEEVGKKVSRFGDILKKFSRRKNVADVFFQLSLLLKSGIPLVQAITILADSASGAYRPALLSIAGRISEGVRFSECMAKYPELFAPMYVNLIQVSEHVGRLADVLQDIAAYEEEKKKALDKLSGALVYPMTVLVLGFGVLGFLLTYVVPKMETIFANIRQEIPFKTKALLAVSRFMQSYGAVLVVLVLAAVLGVRMLYARKESFRLKVDKTLMKFGFIQQVAISRFTHVLAFQLKEGLPLTEAIRFAALTLQNSYLRGHLMAVREEVQSGVKFSMSLKKSGIFPDLVSAAVSTGEKSGNLAELLFRVSEFYGKKVEKFTASFISVLEPLFIVFIGGLVGFIVISIMEPLFQLNTLVQ